jgi:hypothetical protein
MSRHLNLGTARRGHATSPPFSTGHSSTRMSSAFVIFSVSTSGRARGTTRICRLPRCVARQEHGTTLPPVMGPPPGIHHRRSASRCTRRHRLCTLGHRPRLPSTDVPCQHRTCQHRTCKHRFCKHRICRQSLDHDHPRRSCRNRSKDLRRTDLHNQPQRAVRPGELPAAAGGLGALPDADPSRDCPTKRERCSFAAPHSCLERLHV